MATFPEKGTPVKMRLLFAAVAAALTLTSCATGGGTALTQAPATSAPETASSSAPVRSTTPLFRQEARQQLEDVSDEGGKMVCNPDPRRKLAPVNLQINGTIQFGSYQIATKVEQDVLRIIPVNGRYPRAGVLIVNGKQAATIHFSVYEVRRYDDTPELTLKLSDFGGKIETAAFCTPEQ